MAKTAICPWCLEKIQIKSKTKMMWKCPDQHTGKPKENDGLHVCRQCGKRVTRMLCPNPKCGKELPYGWDEFDEYLSITLVGPKSVGKTVYMGRLLDELKDMFTDNYNCSVVPNEDLLYFINEDNDRIRKGMLPEYTVPGEENFNIIEFTNGYLGRTLALIVHDTPGEVHSNYSKVSGNDKLYDPSIATYLQKSDVIFYLIDPLQMTTIRGIINVPYRLPSENEGILTDLFNNVLIRFSNCIKEYKKNVNKKKINKSMAILLMKADALMRNVDSTSEREIIFGPESAVRNCFISPGETYLGPIDIVSDELEKYVEKYANHLSSDIKDRYENYKFFAISSLGTSPEKEGIIDQAIRPFRVCDPVLWVVMDKTSLFG